MYVCLVTQPCSTLCSSMDCSPPGSYVHGNSPGKNTGVGSLFLLQGIFPTQESNPGLPHCRQILYQLPWGSPNITIDAWNIYFNLFIVTFTGQNFFYPTGLEIGWPMVEPISMYIPLGLPQWLWLNIVQKYLSIESLSLTEVPVWTINIWSPTHNAIP